LQAKSPWLVLLVGSSSAAVLRGAVQTRNWSEQACVFMGVLLSESALSPSMWILTSTVIVTVGQWVSVGLIWGSEV
jgi:hypothetical protein